MRVIVANYSPRPLVKTFAEIGMRLNYIKIIFSTVTTLLADRC